MIRRRVLMITHSYYPQDPRVRREAEALVGAGFGVDVLCLRKPGERSRAVHNGVGIFRLPVKRHRRSGPLVYALEYLAFFIAVTVAAAVLFVWRGYRLFQTHTIPDFLVFSTIMPRILGAPAILDMHEVMPEFFAAKFGLGGNHPLIAGLRVIEKASTSFASAVLTVSDPIKDILTGRGVPHEKISVIMNSADDKLFAIVPNRDKLAPSLSAGQGTVAESPAEWTARSRSRLGFEHGSFPVCSHASGGYRSIESPSPWPSPSVRGKKLENEKESEKGKEKGKEKEKEKEKDRKGSPLHPTAVGGRGQSEGGAGDRAPSSTENARTSEAQPVCFVYHGLLSELYDLRPVIHAFAQLRDRGVRDCELNVVGDGPMLAEYRALAQKLRLENAVRFHGEVPVEKIPALLRQTDAAIIPLRRAGFTDLAMPTKFLECIAMGIPVLAADRATLRRYFDDECVLYFIPEDPSSIASAIDKFRDAPRLREELSRNAARRYEAVSWPAVRRRYVQIVEKTALSSK